MRASFLVLMAAAALLAMSGCVKFNADLNIDGKGGGTASVKMSIATEVAQAHAGIVNMGVDMGMDVPPYDTITRPWLEKRAAGRGVTISAFDKGEAAGRRTLACTLSFADVKGISWLVNDLSAAMGGTGLGLAATPDGNVALRTKHYSFPAPPRKAPTPAPTPEQMQQQGDLAATLMGALSELDITVNVTVPGDIVRSNAPKVSGRTSTWAINVANVQQQIDPVVVFSGKGLALPTAAK